MKKFYSLLSVLLFLSGTYCFAQNACVYVAGFTRDANGRQYAASWKSGQLTKLTNGTNNAEVRTIAVSGYDVYVGGFKMERGDRVAAYWKNGKEMPLEIEGDYSTYSNDLSKTLISSFQIYAIKTVGSDVYMFVSQPRRKSSSEPNNYYYYKNGSRQTILISDRQSVSSGIANDKSYFVSRNGDIYILSTNLIDGKVTYWKNGNRIMGSTDLSYLYDVHLKSIFVSDNGDVYIAANKIIGINGGSRAACWKNGNEIQLSYEKGNTYAESIYVEGSTVYVSGSECKTTSHFSAVYWKNGQKTYLHNYDTDGYDATTTSIVTVNGTVYVAGSHKQPLYWVNGKEVKLDQLSTGELFSMTVVNGGGCFNNTAGSTINQSGNKPTTTAAVVSELLDIWEKTTEQRKIYEQQEKERLARVHAEQMAKYTEYQNKMKQTEEYKTFEKAVPVKTRKTIASNVTVQYIIDKYINAIGGLEKLKAIKSVVQRASNGEYLIRGYGQYATNKWSHIQFKGIKFNGIEGYYDDFFGGKKIKIKKNSASFYKKTQPFDILILRQKPDLVLSEIVVFRGKECYTIIENSDFDEEIKEYYGRKQKLVKKHFFDIADGLWIGSEETVTSKDTHGDYVSYIYFDDFREVDGILFPFIKTTMTHNRTDSFATTGIGFDVPLTDQDFEDNPPVFATFKKMPAATNKNNYASHIIGKWADILITSSEGEEKKITNTLSLEYKANGEVFLWESDTQVDLSFKMYWSITGNILTMKSVFSTSREKKNENEIVTVDRTKLVMKTKNEDGTYSIITSKRLE